MNHKDDVLLPPYSAPALSGGGVDAAGFALHMPYGLFREEKSRREAELLGLEDEGGPLAGSPLLRSGPELVSLERGRLDDRAFQASGGRSFVNLLGDANE